MASWTPLASKPAFNADTMLLLTDGTVMCHELLSPNWHRLTPDSTGSYSNGTWSSLAPMVNDSSIPSSSGGPSDAPRYFASAVLRDGRVFVCGGEDNDGYNGVDINGTQIYDPLADSWTLIKPPPDLPKVGDAPACVLTDGRLIIGTSLWDSNAVDILDPNTQIYEQTGAKGDSPSEETWTLLPNGNVLAVQCSNSPNAEQYNPTSNTWIAAGSTPSNLTQPCAGEVAEIGPALLLPNGTVFAIGASGSTAVYTPNADPTLAGTWSAGPNLIDASHNALAAMDAPAVLLPSGSVLLAASPAANVCTYPAPTTFLLYDPATNTATAVTGPGNASEPCFVGRMLLLPNGHVLFANGTTDIEEYTPDGTPQASWAPTITDSPTAMALGHTYTISGTQFNGLSQACSYGDDAQMATNYPIVRLSNASGDVVYLRTSSFSSMGVATGPTIVTTDVTVPTTVTPGSWNMVVVANGIASASVAVTIVAQDCYFTLERSSYGAGEIAALIELHGKPAQINPALYVVVEGYTQNEVGSNTPSIPSPISGITFTNAGAPIPEDPSLPAGAIQSFTFPFLISFADASMFTMSDQTVMISVAFTAGGISVNNQAQIELLATPDPYIDHGDIAAGYPWYLSVDIRVFQMTAGQSAFGTSIASSGSVSANASAYITSAIQNLNAPGSTLSSQFDALPQSEDVATIDLAPADSSGTAVYNFALARVHCQDVTAAQNVRVFFRLWQAQQTNATYDTSTYYRSAASETQKIPLLGLEDDEIVTIPFFASPRVDSTSASMTTQTDPANVQAINPGAGGASVDTYYGCWLDVNQPTQAIFPPWMAGVSQVDGPYNGGEPLVSIQQLVRATHQCLIAEIAYDPDPIPANEDPSTSDKLAQRNLTFINIPNPGFEASRVAPQTFTIKATAAVLPPGRRPDEMMIEWGNTPNGSLATIYLPQVDASEIINWADNLYAAHKLKQLDAHTLSCPTGGIAYIPIPQRRGNSSFAGLMSIALPVTVRKGDTYNVTVRQLTTDYAERYFDDRTTDAAKSDLIIWRRVCGMFNIAIPVSTKEKLLQSEERTLAILRWIQEAIPVRSRWYPIFLRYVQQIASRVAGMGGDPKTIGPSGTGQIPGGAIGALRETIEFVGKVSALVYDRFGDFEAFVLDSGCCHAHRFASRECNVERIIHRAWSDRSTVTVVAYADAPECPLSIAVVGMPSCCC